MSGTFPTSPAPQKMSVTSITPTLVSIAHSLRRQARTRGVQRWSFALSFGPSSRAAWAPLYAFLLSQKGQYSTFLFIPPRIGSTAGTGTGTVTVDGATAAGATTVAISGLSGTLKAGDFIKFAGHVKCYMLTADATTSMSLEPPLLSSLANTEAVTYTDVPFTCALGTDSAASEIIPAGLFSGIDLTILEVA